MIQTSPDLRRLPPRLGGTRLRALVAAAAACAAAFGLLLLAAPRDTAPQAEFLAAALGAPAPEAPLVRTPARGTSVELREDGYRVRAGGLDVGLRSVGGAGGELERYANGAARRTPFGWEAVTIGRGRTEQFLTVTERQGRKTWRWELATLDLRPRVGADGRVTFVRPDGLVAGTSYVDAVRVLDGRGRDVTPKGLRWSVAERDGRFWLELDLDDASLPLPYVIDPAIVVGASNTAVGPSPLAPTRPGSAGDLLIAHVFTRGTGAISAPIGWTQIQQSAGSAVRQATFWAISTGSNSTSFSWTGGADGGAAVIAFANPHPTTPIQASSTNTGTTSPATATGVTTTHPAQVVAAFFGQATNTTITAPTGMTGQYDAQQGGNPSGRLWVHGATVSQASAGATGNKTTTSAADWMAQLVAIRQAPDDGSGTLTTGTASVASSSTGNTITFTYTAGVQGIANGAVAVDVPAGWSAPSGTTSAAGYTTSSTGTPGFSGQRITVTGVTLNAGASMTITYGSKASGGPGATASGTTGAVSWNALARGTAAGTLTALASSPSITQFTPNTAPTATVSLSPASPTTNQTLTATATKNDVDGDPVTLDYVWKVDGVTVKTTSNSGSLTDTLDLSVGGNGDKGDVVSVEVTPNDGTVDGSMVSDSETVANSAPTISAVSIDQAAPTTNQTLTVSVTSADADGDARTYAYQWKLDGSNIPGATSSTLDLSQAGNGDKGEAVTVEVTANDGSANSAPSTSAAVTVANSAPTISAVSIDQAAPTTGQTLTVSITSADADGDARTYSYQWKKNGSNLAGETGATLSLATAGNGDEGDDISVEVTANDGSANSAPSTSAAVTVANSAPSATVSLSPASPTTNQTLTATATKADADGGDTVTLTYVWKVNGATVKTTAGSASLTDTLDLSAGGNGDKGQTVSVEVTPNDGTANGSMVSDSETVANSAPTISAVSIDQASPTTNQTLTVSVTSADADGDTRTYAYQWKLEGTDIPGATGATLDLSQAGNGDKGEAVTVEVTANDGSANSAPFLSAARTIANSAPTISAVSIDQAAPTTNQTLTVSVTSADADGDARTYSYQWKKDGSDLVGETGATLDLSAAGNGDKGDDITVEVTANDGSANSAPFLSAAVTVANSAPTISAVSIDQAAPKTNDVLSVTVTSADADNDARTYSYQWKKNGSNLAGETGATLDLSVAGNGQKGDDISVEVTANDGSANSAPSTSAAVTIQNSAPTVTSVSIDQAAPKTNDTLTTTVATDDADGDAVTVAYQWKKNTVDRFGETASTFDLSQIGNGDKDDDITVEVTADDGTASSAPSLSAAVTVANTAPVLSAVSIDQVAPATNDTLTATITATDADGDTVTPTRQWRKNAADLSGETGASLDLSTAGNGDKGDQIALRVSVSDGTASDGPLTSAAVTVVNSAPTLTSVSIDQASPQTDDTLTVSVTSSDADTDAVTYAYQWRKNGVDIGGETGATLDLSVAGNGDRGDQITVRVTGSDGTASSAPSTSAARTVANTAPGATVSLAPASPTTGQTLTATATKSDDDADTVTLTYVWKVDGATVKTTAASASLTDTLDLSAVGNGDEGETVSVEVTPNDGTADGVLVSDSEVVANSAPSATVSLSPVSPTTNQTLTATATKADADGEAVTLTYVWKVDGATVKTTSGSASLTDTLDLSAGGNGDRGEVVSVEVTPNDGSVDGSMVSDAETVANSAPAMTTAAIVQAAPKTNDTLTVSVASSDADGDARTYAYQWKLDGSDISGATASTLDLSQAGNGDKGDDVTVEVTANDGTASSAPLLSAAVTIQNSAPVATVSLAPDPAGTNDTLTATATKTDADGDAVTLDFVWKVNGATQKTTTDSASLTDTFDLSQPGNGNGGDTISVEVTPNDGTADGALVSDSVGIGNSLPTATVALSPAGPTTGQTLTATATKNDTDGDTVTLDFVWKVDGVTVKTTTDSASLTDTLDLALAGNGDEGETVSVEVTPNDGTADGSTVTDSEVVANTAPTATVALSPAAPKTDDVVTATATKADADGDTVTLTYVWKVDGATVKTTSGSASLTDTLDLAQAGNGDKGEVVSVEVTPDDGDAAGSTVTDSETVANSAPVLSAVSIDQAAPKTDDTLTLTVTATDADGDTLTPARQWRKNGGNLAGETGATLDLSTAGNGDKGDDLDVQLSVSDGAASSATLTATAVTVVNSAPTVVSATIDQAAPKTNETLTVTVVTDDADGDATTETFQWAKNAADRFGETASTFDLSPIGNGDKGDAITVRVVTDDGDDTSAPLTSAAVTVANSAPVVDTVSIDQAAPKTNDTLTLSVTSHDDDGDAVTYAFQWRKNAADLGGATASTLDLSGAGNGDEGDAIAVRVTGGDGTATSAPLTSGAVTVANTAPTATVALSPASPTTNQTLTATATKADADGDAVTLTYVWKVDGATVKTTSGSASLTDTLDLAQAGNGDKGEVVSVEVTPDDGDAAGSTVTDSETVANSAPTITSVTIDQALPTTATVLSVSVVSADADGDGRTHTYQWRRNGVDIGGETGSTLDLGVAGNGDKGDAITVRVVASDGSASSAPSTSAAVTVQNSAPTISTVTIDQGAPQTDDVLSVTVSSADADGDARSYTYQWRLNGADLAGETGATLDLSAAGNGDKGDAISVRVTASDGTDPSAPSTSAAVTVQNSAPTITSLVVDQAAPKTLDTLTYTLVTDDADGDTLTPTRQWRKNGGDLAGETGATLDLAQAGNGDKGDTIALRISVSDGSASSSPTTSAGVAVVNSAPVVDSVSIDQGAPQTDDTLTLSVASHDDDGDGVTYAYQWRNGGSDLGGETGATLDLSVVGNGQKGDAIDVRVTGNDGTASSAPLTSGAVTVANTAPTATVALSPASPTTDQTLTATATKADADGEAVTLTYVWKVDGATVKTTPGSASLTDTLDLGVHADEGEVVTVEVTPDDGDAAGSTVSDSETVANSAPNATVALSPASPTTGQTLTATATKADADGEAVTLTYVWKVNGATVKTTAGSASLTDTLDLSAGGNGDKGQTVSVEVTPNDGTVDGTMVSDSETVANSAPTISAVAIDQAAPTTNQTLTVSVTSADADGDARTHTYQWKKNGSDLAGETGATLDLSQAGNGNEGDQITVEVTADDGTASSSPFLSGAVTVANSAPTISAVSIDQPTPQTNDLLSVTVTSADADAGDTITHGYQWKKNGTDLAGETGATLDLSAAGNGGKGDGITVEVTAGDGTASSAPFLSGAVTIRNTAPVITGASIVEASAFTNDTLTSSVTTTDADGDTVTVTRQWTKGGVDLAGETGASLDLSVGGNGDRGDALRVRAEATDGDDDAAPVTSAPLVVSNSLPTATVALAPASPATDDVVTATATKADLDADTVTLTYVWKVDGVTVKTTAGSASLTDTLDLALAGNGDGGETVSVDVTPHDGTAAGATDTDSVVVDFVATQLAFTSPTTDLASGAQRTLEVEIRDADGAVVADDDTTQVTFAKTAGTGTVTGLGTATAENGVVTLDVTGALAGALTITATATGLASDASSFTVVHGTAAALDLALSGSNASGATKTLTATIEDAAGNTVTGDGTTVVTFAQTGGTGTVGGLGTDTAAAGVASLDVTNQLAGPVDLEATAGALTPGTASYTITAGAASTATSTIDAAPATIVANGTSTSTITVQLKDAAGNDLTASGGVVALSLTGTGSLGSVTDEGDGTYTATLTSPTAVGSGTVTGTLDAVALADSAAVTYAHGPATAISLGESGSTVAGGSHTLTATIVDANGNTVTSDNSTVVTFAKTGGAGTASGFGTATASAGVATKVVTNRLAGQLDAEATAGVLADGTASWTIVVGPVSAADSSVTASPTSVLNNGTDTSTITVTVRDAGGNPLPNETVVLDHDDDASVTITVVDDTTNASGVATFTTSNTDVESVVYDATADGVAITDTATVAFVFDDSTPPTNAITLASATGAYLSGTTLWYNGAAGGSFTLSSAVADSGAGPGSATYPPLFGYAGATVSTPAGGPYESGAITWTAGTTGTIPYTVTAADAWAPANELDTTLNVTEDSTAPASSALCDGAACDADPYTTSPVSVTLSAGDGGGSGVASIRYTTDGSDPTILDPAYAGAISVAGEGATTVKFRAYDRVGNEEAVQTLVVEIDTTPPVTSLDSTPAAATQDTTPTFAFSADEPSTFEYRLDGGAWTAATSPLTLGPLAEDTYTFEVRATDAAGNVDATPASFVFTVDTTAADTTITSAPPSATNDTTPTFAFTATDAGPSFEYRVDGGAWQATTSPLTLGPLAEATYVVELRAVDAAGNRDASPASSTFTVDTTAPGTAIDVAPADPDNDATPTFVFSSEPGSTFACSVDGGAYAPCASPLTTGALGDGARTFAVRATDAAGNDDPTPAQHSWTLDATAPTGALTAPAHGAAVSGDVVVSSDSADTGGTGVMHAIFEYRLAATSDPWGTIGAADTSAPYAVTWDTDLVSDEDYELRVRTVDEAGNETVSATREVVVDNTVPTVALTAPAYVKIGDPDPATLTATATDAGTGIASVLFEQCNDTTALCSGGFTALGVDTVAPYAASWPIPTDGTRLVRATATDGAGRTATDDVLVTVDRTRPTGTVTSPADGAALRGNAVGLTANASDATSGVDTVTFQISPAGADTWTDVEVGGDDTAPYTATLDTTAHGDGLYDLRVFTLDAAGNAEGTPATIEVRIDNTAPATTDDAPAAWQDGDVTVALAANDAGGSGVTLTQYKLDGGSEQTYSAPVTVSGEGVHTLEYRSQDAAGNVEAWQTATVRIDETDPVTTDDAPAAWQPGAVTVTLSPSDAGGSGLATTTYELDGGATQTGTSVSVPAAHGVHTITYRSTDAAGNVEAQRTATVRIDLVAPTTTDDAPAGLTNMPVTVTLAPADADSGVATTTYEVNGGATQTGTTVAIPATTGTYTITYRSTDAVGNAEADQTAIVQIDATAPTTTPTISPANPHNGPITVSLSASDAGGAGVDETFFRIDAAATWTSGTSAVVTGADGPHTVDWYSVDTLGNVEATQSVTVTIDTTGPSGTPGDPGSYLTGTAAELAWTPDTPADVSAVTFEFSVAGANAWAALPGGTIATPMLAEYTYSWNTTLVADGPYDLRVVVEDALGNETTVLLPGLPKTVDNGAPSASVSTPANGSFVSGNVALGGSANDALSGITASTLQVKPAGAAGFTTVGTSATGIVAATWDSTTVADGTVELKVVATDGAGNQGESAVVTFTVDNDAPAVTLADPGAAVSGATALSATGDGDIASVEFQRSPSGANTWTTISTDATAGDGFTALWATGSLADGLYDLRARATDGGGNTGTSPLRTTRVDNALPNGSVTSPPASATVGGPSVALAATASDTGSGVASVRFEVKHFGSGSFVAISTDTAAPFAATWDATTAPDGATELRAVIADAAGNERVSAVVPVTVDSTGPSVTLVTPAAGAVVSGALALTTTTGGGAVEVRFGVTPAGGGTWTELAADATAPFAHTLDTSTLADGLYDLRAVGFDSLGNPSAPSVVAGVRFDNTAPSLVSAAPADGSVSASASQIALTASEPVTVVGALLDGAAAPAPAIAGNVLTFATGALADGLHVLEGRLEDASGTQVPFRVAVTIESTPPADRAPVEKSVAASGTTTVTAAGALATVSLPADASPTPPTADDFLVLRVDPAPAGSVAVAPGTQLVEVTARWALAGTAVTQFSQPLDVLLPSSTGFTIPAVSDDGTSFRLLTRLAGTTLPSGQADGYYVDGAGVHVVTRHLTWFALVLDDEPPTAPSHIAGVVAADGLTIRWIPGSDATGQLGNVVLYVNGEAYQQFGPTQYEVKLGPIAPGDTRAFHLVQRDAAGNTSGPSAVLRAVPTVAGLSLEAATAALAERGFGVGAVTEEVVTTVAPGTVLGPAGITLAAESSKIDLTVARGAGAPQTQFVMRVANAKQLKLTRRTTVAARVQVTRPARLTATLYSPTKKRLYTWRRNVPAGNTIVRLRLPVQVRRPGTYRVVWVARSGAETIRRAVRFRLIAPQLEQLTPKRQEVEVVLAGEKPLKGALVPELEGTGTRVVADADSDETFALAAALSRNVKVVVVDVDRYGVGFVRDLAAVFPELKLIALARDRRVRAQSLRAGAVLALPRSTPPARLAKAIARVGRK